MTDSPNRGPENGQAAAARCRTFRRRGPLQKRPAVLACFLGLAALAPGGYGRAEEPRIQSLPKAQVRSGEDERPEDRILKQRLEMSEVEILGEVDKPKTMFVIPRSPHQYVWESDKRDFTEEILAPVDRRSMEGLQQWREASGPP